MKVIETVLATDRIDRHGDRFTREALEGAAEQTREHYLPVIFNHDPRVPPLGRTIGARVREVEDGSCELVAVAEVFEPGDDVPLHDPDKRMIVQEFVEGRLTLVADRSYRSAEDQEALAELAESPEVALETFEKKALEPLSVLLLGVASAAVLSFASGFLSKMGGDAWDLVKRRLAELLSRRRKEQREFLFIFEVQLLRDVGALSVQCVLTNPTEEDLQSFWSEGIAQFEHELPYLLHTGPEVVRVVMHYQDRRLVPGFAIRSDCVPLPLA